MGVWQDHSLASEGSEYQRRRRRLERRAFARDAARGMCAVCDAARRRTGAAQTLSQRHVGCAAEVQSLGDKWLADKCRAIGEGRPISS